jgi:hypothetical protein
VLRKVSAAGEFMRTGDGRMNYGSVTFLFFAGLVGGTMTADAARADTSVTRFDGVWQTILSCPDSHGALGYSFKFNSLVKNGALHGEKGTRDEAGWLQIDGAIKEDGKASLYADGLVGAADFAVGQRPAGTRYNYHIDALFTATSAEGHRVEGRKCSVVWTRN